MVEVEKLHNNMYLWSAVEASSATDYYRNDTMDLIRNFYSYFSVFKRHLDFSEVLQEEEKTLKSKI